MPWYRVIVYLKSGVMRRGLRQNESWNIDAMYSMYLKKANDYYGSSKVKTVDVVMVPKNSDEVKRLRK
ncbi:hypothetical protein [Lacibacter sp.]|uniref:hypothetical protein n=1 Tax=Lacibacter sp. TaxID=1915409 RepID=UPI002B4AC583|nr:hypothetical protein [Lacibacter sp.]HLP37749.1 hypothetical protein [Lacibacter sp.]